MLDKQNYNTTCTKILQCLGYIFPFSLHAWNFITCIQTLGTGINPVTGLIKC